MTPPRTDLDTQTRRHRGPIFGITLGLLFVGAVAIAAFLWGGWPLDEQAAPDGVATERVPVDAAEDTAIDATDDEPGDATADEGEAAGD